MTEILLLSVSLVTADDHFNITQGFVSDVPLSSADFTIYTPGIKTHFIIHTLSPLWVM